MSIALQTLSKPAQITFELTEREKLLQMIKQEYNITYEQLEQMKEHHKESMELLDVYFLLGIIVHDWSEMESYLASFL